MLDFRPLAGLAGILLLVALLGSMATFGISNTDLANFITNSAEARALDQKTQFESEKAAIDLDTYRQVEATMAQVEQQRILVEAELQKKQAELDLETAKAQYQIELDNQRLAAEQQLKFDLTVRYTFLVIGALAVLILCGGMAYRFVKLEHRQYGGKVSDKTGAIRVDDRWHTDPEWRGRQIERARMKEREKRSRVKPAGESLMPITSILSAPNPFRNYNDLPKAE